MVIENHYGFLLNSTKLQHDIVREYFKDGEYDRWITVTKGNTFEGFSKIGNMFNLFRAGTSGKNYVFTSTAIESLKMIKCDAPRWDTVIDSMPFSGGTLFLPMNEVLIFNRNEKYIEFFYSDMKKEKSGDRNILFTFFYIDTSTGEVFEHKKNDTGKDDLISVFKLMTFLFCSDHTFEILPPKKKHVDSRTKEKTLNNTTRTNVVMVDSKWNITSIRNEGFGVSGHYRLQPYGNEKTSKYIFIKPYQKEGYTRKAKSNV